MSNQTVKPTCPTLDTIDEIDGINVTMEVDTGSPATFVSKHE